MLSTIRLDISLPAVCSNCFCKSLHTASCIPLRVGTIPEELTRTQRAKRCPCTLLLLGSCDETPHCWRDICLLPLMFCCPAVSLPFLSNPDQFLILSHRILSHRILSHRSLSLARKDRDTAMALRTSESDTAANVQVPSIYLVCCQSKESCALPHH